jgi:hypothetical protein
MCISVFQVPVHAAVCLTAGLVHPSNRFGRSALLGQNIVLSFNDVFGMA